MSVLGTEPQEGAGLGSRGGIAVGRDLGGLVLVADHAHSTERYQGHVGASLIVGGVDLTGPQLYGVHPHGSYSRLPFAALGERFSPFSMNPAPRPLPHVCPAMGRLQLTSDAPPACRLRPGCGSGSSGGPVPAEHDSERHLASTTRSLVGSDPRSSGKAEVA